MTDRLARSLRQEGLCAQRVTVKIRFPNFKTITRSETLPQPTDVNDEIYQAVKRLFLKALPRRVRLLGLSLSGLVKAGELPLFPEDKKVKEESLVKAIDKIQEKYGEEAIKRALQAKGGARKRKSSSA